MRFPAFVVFWKECVENLRDRKTVTNALIMGPLLGPVLFAGLFSLIMNREIAKAEKPLEVPVLGAEHAPNLMAYLRRQGLEPQDPIEDVEAAIRRQDVEVVLRIPAEYPDAWRRGETAQVEILYDGSQRESNTPVRRLNQLLEGYKREQSALRIAARGLHPAVLTPIAIAERDVSTAQARSALLLSMLPYFLIIGAFLGGMYLAIDTTAGERERQSLEPLLANPVRRGEIVAGKLGATFAFALLSLLLSLIAFSIAFRFLPLDRLGISLAIGPQFIATAIVLFIPLVLLFAALQTIVSAYAKSYREAQTYLSLLMLVPLLPTVMLAILPVKTELWMMSVPLLSQHLLVMKLVRGETILPAELSLALASGMLVALLLCWLCALTYRREQLAISA